MSNTHSSNVMARHVLDGLLSRIDARQLAGAASLLLHLSVLVWAFSVVKSEIGMEQENTYIEVSLKNLPAPKPRKKPRARKPPPVVKKVEPVSKPKEVEKPKPQGPVDLDKLAASLTQPPKAPPPVAPIAPAPVPAPAPQPAPNAVTQPDTSPDTDTTDTSEQESQAADAALVGVLPDWCPKDEALLSASVQEPEMKQLYDIYIGSIKNRVSDNWVIPPILTVDAKCTLFIEQLVSGDIVRYEFAYCTGGEGFRHSVEEAIKRTTLPIPPDRRLYSRCIGFDFIPGEL